MRTRIRTDGDCETGEISPKPENQAQNQPKSSGDVIIDTGDISPDDSKVSPANKEQNRAQNETSGDINDAGDILPLSYGSANTLDSNEGCCNNNNHAATEEPTLHVAS